MIKFNDLFSPSSRWYFSLRILILFFLGLALYYQTFAFGFVFDDKMFIVNDYNIKNFKEMHYIWSTFPKTRLIGMYSFALNYYLGHLDPRGYHIFNFLIHLVTTGLVWALTRTLFRITGWFSSDDKTREELAFIIALLFLVHPGQTQAVTYISQRFESMAAMFYVGSMLCYLHGRIASINMHKILFFGSASLFALLGILTKETPATIPAMILAVEFILFHRGSLILRKFSSWKFLLPVLILGTIFVLFFMHIVRINFSIFFNYSDPSASHDGDIINGGKYVLTQMRVFLTFLRLLILPINQNVDYDYPLSTGLFSPPLTLAGLCLIGFMAFLIIKIRENRPLIAFGLAWILITFSINIAPRVNVIFEHKLYLISFGFILATVCSLSTVIKDRKILFGLLIALIAILSFACYKRNQVWINESTLWEDVVKKSPHKARGYVNQGMDFINQGKFSQAMSDFNKALKINPEYADAYKGRGSVYDEQGDNSQALLNYDKAIEINPLYMDAYVSRSVVFSNQGKFDLAIADLNRAIELKIFNSVAYNNRGSLYARQGEYLQAWSDYNKAISVDPYNVDANHNRLEDYKAMMHQLGNYGN